MFNEQLDSEAAFIATHFNRKNDVAFGWKVMNAIADVMLSTFDSGSLLDDINTLKALGETSTMPKRKQKALVKEVLWQVRLIGEYICSLDTGNKQYMLEEAIVLFENNDYLQFIADANRVHEIANIISVKLRPAFPNRVKAEEWLSYEMLWRACEAFDTPQWKEMETTTSLANAEGSGHMLRVKWSVKMEKENAEHIYGLFRLIEWYFHKDDVKLDTIAVLNRVNGTYYDSIVTVISDYLRSRDDLRIDDGTASEVLDILEYYGIRDDYETLLKGVPVEDLTI